MPVSSLRGCATWVAWSAGSLLVIELALKKTTGIPYTHLYRAARQAPGIIRYAPVAAAAVTFAHLEGWIPEKYDPFSVAAKAFKWI